MFYKSLTDFCASGFVKLVNEFQNGGQFFFSNFKNMITSQLTVSRKLTLSSFKIFI